MTDSPVLQRFSPVQFAVLTDSKDRNFKHYLERALEQVDAALSNHSTPPFLQLSSKLPLTQEKENANEIGENDMPCEGDSRRCYICSCHCLTTAHHIPTSRRIRHIVNKSLVQSTIRAPQFANRLIGDALTSFLSRCHPS